MLLTLSIIVSCGFVYCLYFIKKKREQYVLAQQKIASLQHAAELQAVKLGELQAQLIKQGEDPVTKALTMPLFMDRINQYLKESARYHLTLGLLVIDVDEFKLINDAFGTEGGNLLLQEVAKRLQVCIRQVDSLARFNKDIFYVLLPQLSKPETAALVAQRMMQSIALPIHITEKEICISASIGIAIYPNDAKDSQNLLLSAEYALAQAKQKGKGNYQYPQERLYAQSQRELALNTSLNKQAFAEHLLVLYQPIIRSSDKHIVAMEALLHWQHKEHGVLAPAELISYAKRQRKLNAVSEWLIETACRDMLIWQARGFTPDYVAIPLWVQQLESPQFIYRISQIIQELNFPKGKLLLVMQDGHAAISSKTFAKALSMLKYIEVKIAFEDFGNDNFPFIYLKKEQINFLKLSPDLVKGIDNNSENLALLKSILHFTSQLGIQPIAQGVCLAAESKLLKSLGCYLLAGPLLSVPCHSIEAPPSIN